MATDTVSNLSIIIVTWNGDDLLKNCLDSVCKVYGTAPEIIVVDNANQASCAALVSNYPNAAYIAAPDNLGFAGGNNLGLAKTTRDYILLLNNDTIVYKDSFTPLIDFLSTHEKVGIVQGTMNVPALNNGLDDCGVLMTPFGIQRHLHHGEPTATTKLSPRKVFAAKGAMLMFKRIVLKDTGFLFYDHFKSYYEETDFCHRAKLKGWETWFVPTPPIDHLGGRTSGKFKSEDIWAQYLRNIFYSFHRNYGFWGHIFTIPCFFCAALIKAPQALIKAIRKSSLFLFNQPPPKPSMIFSLTSFPARLPHIEPCLRSLIAQKGDDDQIILWLGNEEFPRRLEDVPDNIRRIPEVQIRFTRDIKSFKKLLPAVEAFPDDPIITFDDDVIYDKNTVSRLKAAHLSDPSAIWAHTISDIRHTSQGWIRTFGANGVIWPVHPLRLMTGAGGVLYPPHSLDPTVSNINLAMSCARTGDDIWFWYAAAKRGTSVRRVPSPICDLHCISIANNHSLSEINEVDNDRVNRQFIRNIFDLDPDFEKRCLEQCRRHRIKMLIAVAIRRAFYYPMTAFRCLLHKGGCSMILAEIKRRYQN